MNPANALAEWDTQCSKQTMYTYTYVQPHPKATPSFLIFQPATLKNWDGPGDKAGYHTRTCIVNSTKNSSTTFHRAMPNTYLYRFAFLPLLQQFSCLLLHHLVLCHYLHLEVAHLGLNSCVLSLHDLVEGSPLSFHIVHIDPRWRELEPLTVKDLLPGTEHLYTNIT